MVRAPGQPDRALAGEEYYVPGSILRVATDPSAQVTAGLPSQLDVFFDNSPVFRLKPDAALKGTKADAWFDSATPLRSGWAWGQNYLEGGAAVVEANYGKGKVYLFGPEITFRGQPHGTFKFLFNGIYAPTESGAGGAVSVRSCEECEPPARKRGRFAFRVASIARDWLFVNKLRFGSHIPFTSHSLPGYASPKRGDVTVFISPPRDGTIRISPDQVMPTLVKRIVGVMGDDRDDSVDSRCCGLVPRVNLRGTPMFVYYSYDPERGVDYARAVTAIRWRRLGVWIR